LYCPQCGTENSNLAKFCQKCGGNLSATPPLEPLVRKAEYAGFWLRFVAAFIDGLILMVPAIVVTLIGTAIDLAATTDPYNPATGGKVLAYLINIVVGWLYFSLMESSSKQATLGKLALSLKVTDLDGKRLTFGRATGRYFAKLINSFTFSIGYIMAGFTKHKQGLHDFIASTLVVKR
jgi:uncharacterized RDD family membrane protein YckC